MAPKTARERARARRATRSTRSQEEPEALIVDAVDIEIEDLSAASPTKNVIIYGPSGHGKSVLAAGAPNAVIVSTETTGFVSAKRVGHQAKLIRAPHWEHVEAAMNRCEKEFGPEDWVVWDSITKMQQLNIRWILRMQHAKKSSRDLDIPAVQDHQKWQNQFLRYINRIIDAPYNSIMLATSMIKEDEDGEDIVMPNLVGKNYTISQNVCAEACMVLYYAVSKAASTEEETVRRILAQPYPPYFAKDRYHCLGKRYDVGEGEYWAMYDIVDRIEAAASGELDNEE